MDQKMIATNISDIVDRAIDLGRGPDETVNLVIAVIWRNIERTQVTRHKVVLFRFIQLLRAVANKVSTEHRVIAILNILRLMAGGRTLTSYKHEFNLISKACSDPDDKEGVLTLGCNETKALG